MLKPVVIAGLGYVQHGKGRGLDACLCAVTASTMASIQGEAATHSEDATKEEKIDILVDGVMGVAASLLAFAVAIKSEHVHGAAATPDSVRVDLDAALADLRKAIHVSSVTGRIVGLSEKDSMKECQRVFALIEEEVAAMAPGCTH